MDYAAASNRPIPGAVATLGTDARMSFLRKTYGHLAGAVGLFVLLEALLVNSELGIRWAIWATSGWHWFAVLGLFLGSNWLAERFACSSTSRALQYAGLGLLVVAWAFVFVPIMAYAVYYAGPTVLPTAATLTLFVFGGLTATVFITKKDFSFLGGMLSVGFLIALGVIGAGMLFGFNLGLWFSIPMVLLAAGSVLYSTSRVMEHYPPTYWVAASLELFSALALLFFYILRIIIAFNE